MQWSSRIRAEDIHEHPGHHKVSMKKKERGFGRGRTRYLYRTGGAKEVLSEAQTGTSVAREN